MEKNYYEGKMMQIQNRISRENVSYVGDFQQNGFASITSFASLDDIAQIRRIAERLIGNNTGFEEGSLLDFTGDDTNSTTQTAQLMDIETYAPEVSRLSIRKAGLKIAQAALGPSAKLVQDHVFYKPAFNNSETPWHQDRAFFPDGLVFERINIWVPLQPVDETNGCMRFIPKTHVDSLLPHRPANNNPRSSGLECIGAFDESQAVPVTLPLGGCCFHAMETLHGAGANGSNSPRYAYMMVFQSHVRNERHSHLSWQNRDTDRHRRARAWRAKEGHSAKMTRLFKRLYRSNAREILAHIRRKLG